MNSTISQTVLLAWVGIFHFLVKVNSWLVTMADALYEYGHQQECGEWLGSNYMYCRAFRKLRPAGGADSVMECFYLNIIIL